MFGGNPNIFQYMNIYTITRKHYSMLKINEVSNHRKIRKKQVLKEKAKIYVMN